MAATALAVLVIAVFGQTVSFGWINLDDDVNVTKNPHLEPVTAASLRRLWTDAYENLYVPAAYTLFAAEVEASWLVYGRKADSTPDPRLFHGVSLALHTINVLLVWWLLVRATHKQPWPAALGAALFAIHPLQVESVTWISEQRGLLSATFSLAAMVLHVSAGRSERRPAERWGCAVAAMLCFGLALLSKPQAVAVPLIAFLLDASCLRRPVRTAVLELFPWVLLAGLAAVVTRGLQTASEEDVFVQWWQRLLVAGDAVAFYASKLVFPVGLCIDYGRTPRSVLAQPTAWAAAIATWIGLAGIACLPPLRPWRLPVAVFIVALAPVLGFIPFLFQTFSTVADRYAYLALLGPAIALAWAAQAWLTGPSRLPLAASCLCMVLLAGTSVRQSRNWRNAIALNERALRVNPGSFLGACNLGAAIIDVALVEPDRLPEALPLLERAVTARPGHVNANLSMGIALDKLGRLDEATPFYEAVLSRWPMHAEANNYLGVIHARQGSVDRAAEYFQRALSVKPEYRDAAKNLDRARKILDAQSR